ncbi:MAG: SDR family oxidoreductase [Longimicrobiales bacterium]
MNVKTLVIGASGTVGSGVVRELVRCGADVVGASRDPAAAAARMPGVRFVRFDLEEPDTWRDALAGISRVLLMARPGDDEPQRLANPLIDEMRAVGVRHVVNLTAMGVETREDMGLRQVERHLEASGIPFTHLRPNFFMQIFMGDALAAGIRSGVLAVPAGDARLSFIDARDIAAVAAEALSGGGHEGRAYTLTGPEAMDHAAVAAAIGNAVGRPVRYVALEEADARGRLAQAGLPPARIERLVGFYRLVRAGYCAPVTGDVQQVLGRPPATFAAFVGAHRQCWE